MKRTQSINYINDGLYVSPSTMNILQHGANRLSQIKSTLDDKQMKRFDSLMMHKN